VKRVLIIGASGFVGINLAIYLRRFYRVMGTYATGKPRIDGVPMFQMKITPESPIQEIVRGFHPDAIVYSAAWIDNQKCEADPKLAAYINAEVPYLLARVLDEYGGRFIYFSTSKVFSGQSGGYAEDSIPDPQGIYGATKVRAEELLTRLSNAFIFRLGTVYGLGSFRQRTSVLNRFLDELWSGKELSLIHDEYRSFLPMEDICQAVGNAIDCSSDLAGIYHLAPPERHSYYTFGQQLVEAFRLRTARLTPIPGAGFAGELAAAGGARGSDLTLNGNHFATIFRYRYSTMEKTLARYCDRLKNGTQ
jgi:dTDP-4-dehydrorhamnose reductase